MSVCPLATRPDATGCDRDCGIPKPRGFWAGLLYTLCGLTRCTSGLGGCGDGSLPCDRYDEHIRRVRSGEGA